MGTITAIVGLLLILEAAIGSYGKRPYMIWTLLLGIGVTGVGLAVYLAPRVCS